MSSDDVRCCSRRWVFSFCVKLFTHRLLTLTSGKLFHAWCRPTKTNLNSAVFGLMIPYAVAFVEFYRGRPRSDRFQRLSNAWKGRSFTHKTTKTVSTSQRCERRRHCWSNRQTAVKPYTGHTNHRRQLPQLSPTYSMRGATPSSAPISNFARQVCGKSGKTRKSRLIAHSFLSSPVERMIIFYSPVSE